VSGDLSNPALTPLATTKRMLALWRNAERQDALVGEKLHETRSCDREVALDDAAFFDELFNAWAFSGGRSPSVS
jgi:hypothetical protein